MGRLGILGWRFLLLIRGCWAHCRYPAGKVDAQSLSETGGPGRKMFSHLLLSNWKELENTSENLAVPENE